ncbi:MAG: AAA family ATPase [Kiritimatiellae bacterium]|nr:AAA family ATPase [Kiritimatiellia bacterium]
MNLFEPRNLDKKNQHAATCQQPLATQCRPITLEEFVGQDHILGTGKLLRRAIEADRLSSIILYGPPGCGKTSLAEVIAHFTKRRFERTSGILANIADLRNYLQTAQQLKDLQSRETILFIDEIHRFNKAQQDILLPYIEEGSITLIGATTHNPFFFINSPLTSRSQIFQLEPLEEDAILTLLQRALDRKKGLGNTPIHAEPDALEYLAKVCEGDARRALNALEIAALTTPPNTEGICHLTPSVIEESIQKKAVVYDHDEDGHYDTISAFIKSVRGSDPDAAIYWLAKMLYAGEDPRFIARRLIILASEDIGNADPRALTLTTSAMEAVDFIGMPEARIILAQATTYLACAPKSNASYQALQNATQDIKEGRTLPIPRPLRSAAYQGAKELGHKGYKYAHDYQEHIVDQEYVPTSKKYYTPTHQGYEETLGKRLEHWSCLRKQQTKKKKS